MASQPINDFPLTISENFQRQSTFPITDLSLVMFSITIECCSKIDPVWGQYVIFHTASSDGSYSALTVAYTLKPLQTTWAFST